MVASRNCIGDRFHIMTIVFNGLHPEEICTAARGQDQVIVFKRFVFRDYLTRLKINIRDLAHQEG